ncbi:BMP family ABC transporter substrate-binding protein [Bittarella sp. HCP28S3_D9]|uniref:BMP family ABC transporter substrate-binding protein n=1 Tax=Bittarella sp. HCP28S3_D9 TaxID=3440253 RepID=UPI003F886D31
MKKYASICLAALLALGLFATGCGQKESAGGEGKEGQIQSACYLTYALGDKSFHDLANEGLTKAGKELGIQTKTIEYGTDKSKMEPAILDAMDNYDMVLFYTGEQLEIIKRYAADYADVKFVGFDIDPDIEPEFPNIFCMTYAQNEGEFLAGALAAKMSKSGTVGFVTGTESPVINDFMVGYIEGAQHVKSDIKVAISYSGDFTNTTKTKEVALLQIQQNGADVIHQVAAGAGLGVFEAVAQYPGVWAIGVDADQRNFFVDTKPAVADVILTSMMKRNDIVLCDLVKQTYAGTADFYGTRAKWGISAGAVGLADNEYYRQNTPQEVRDYIADCQEKVTGGEIAVSTGYGMEQSTVDEIRNRVRP